MINPFCGKWAPSAVIGLDLYSQLTSFFHSLHLSIQPQVQRLPYEEVCESPCGGWPSIRDCAERVRSLRVALGKAFVSMCSHLQLMSYVFPLTTDVSSRYDTAVKDEADAKRGEVELDSQHF
jgi:hypothetical protein